MVNELLQSIGPALYFLPLLLGLIIVRFAPLPLKALQGIYLLLGTSLVFLALQGLLPQEKLVWVVGGLLLGEVVHLLAIGLGGKLSIANNAAILFGIGLFPWWFSPAVSVFYVLGSLLFMALGSMVNSYLAGKKLGVRGLDPRAARKHLSDDAFEGYKRRASIFFATYFFIAAVAAFALFRY